MDSRAAFAGTDPDQSAIMLRGLESADTKRVGQVDVWARCDARRSREPAIEPIAGRLSLEPSVSAVQGVVAERRGRE
jgi:hypothetical protein